MNKHLSYVLLLIMVCSAGYAQGQGLFSFDSLFAKYPQAFDSVIAHREDYRLQIIYTRIDRDASNVPHLTTYAFDADRYYYYCASMMKLPASVLALEKLNNLAQYRVSMLDSLGVDSIACPDLGTESMMLGTPYSCLSQYIKEMLLVSNNNAFNPVYDFLGQYDMQERLHQLGYSSAVVSNRYAGCDTSQNRYTDPVALYDRLTHQVKYSQLAAVNPRRQFYPGPLSPLVGSAYLGNGGVVNEPKNFRFLNYISLSDVHRLLTKVMLPETQALSEKLSLTHNDYQYLYKCMGMFPRECAYPAFDSVHYPDNYMKYFMNIDSGSYTMPSNIRIFNKVGQAYGFMTDASYVIDTLNKVEFFLSCSMYLNADGILNDGKYEYDQIGYPFFYDLFNAVYAEELTRPRQFLPKLALPDFSDTLLVRPAGKPAWMKVDSIMSAEQIERILISLADSMWHDRRLAINYDNPTADEIFHDNLRAALAMYATVGYPFDALQQKGISILTSDDRRLRVFSWNKDSPASNYALLQFSDLGRAYPRAPGDFLTGDIQPKLIYTNLYELPSLSGPVYLLRGETSVGTGMAEYWQVYGWRLGRPVRMKVFRADPDRDIDTLYDAILIEKNSSRPAARFDSKRQILSYPVRIKTGKKSKTKMRKLRFDGAIFR